MNVLTWPGLLLDRKGRHPLLERLLRAWQELRSENPWNPGYGGGGIAGGTGSGGAGAPTSTVASSAGGGAARQGSAAGNLMPWLFPTADFLNFDKGPSAGFTGQVGATSGFGAVALPAIGASATILSFRIPQGRNAKITALGIDYVQNGGAAFTQGTLPAPLTFAIGVAGSQMFADYESFNFSPGAVSSPIPISGLMAKENQTVFVRVTNNNIVVTTQFIAARVQGYSYSKNLEPTLLSYQ